MSWVDALSAELRAARIPGREQARIIAELRDHIACEPGCEARLGDPRELAITFADELATSRVRGSAFEVFGALTMTAIALIVSQLAIVHAAGGYPGPTRGISLLLFVPACLGILVAPQVGLVAGTLAAVRATRRRRTPRLPAAENRLIAGRARVAIGAGFGTAAGLGLYLVNFSPVLPAWYLGLVGSLAAVAAAALAVALRRLGQAEMIVCTTAGPAGDVYDDVPIPGWRRLRRRPWALGAVGSLGVAALVTALTGSAEHSLAEGLQRGIAEGIAAAVGFALLGRAVGLLPPRPRPTMDGSRPTD